MPADAMSAPSSEVTADDGPGVPTPVAPFLRGGRLLILVVALVFLGGAVGYAVGHRTSPVDPLSATDAGFMRDMNYHHGQANQMSIVLDAKPSVDGDLKSIAIEIIMSQRQEQGVFTATLDRFGYSSSPGTTAMGWMGPALPLDSMSGLATPAQFAALRKATGPTAEALWIALMSEHHLGGMHMADYEARHGHDRTTVNLAKGMVAAQRGEVIELAYWRKQHHLPIPKGFDDPLKDPRLNPLSFTSTPH